jgi:ComF family protein
MRTNAQLKNLYSTILYAIFPRNCVSCKKTLLNQEDILCLKCANSLPYTYFHQVNQNPAKDIFWGRLKLEHADSFLFFEPKGKVQLILHALKYKGRQDLGRYLGYKYGKVLETSTFFNDVDLITAIPIHKAKLKSRGYNQAEPIAFGIGKAMHKPVDNAILEKVKQTASQTKKGRFERWENVKDVFEVTKSLEPKHVLLVDDVLTTGATIEAAGAALIRAGHRVSVVTIAFASRM